AEYDDPRLAPLRLADDRAAGASGTQQPPDHVDTVELADRDGRVERLVRGGLSLRQLGIERQLHRHHDYADRRDRRTALGGEPAGEVARLLRLSPRLHRHEDAAVLDGA